MLRNILVVRFIYRQRNLADFQTDLSLIYISPIKILSNRLLMTKASDYFHLGIMVFPLSEYD
jgi:hypothetical protein